MLHRMNQTELEHLRKLIWEEVYTGGSCKSQDENGVGHNCILPPYTGILRNIEVDESTMGLSAIVLECASGMEKIDLDMEPDNWTWNIERGIYHKGQLILEVSTKTTKPVRGFE